MRLFILHGRLCYLCGLPIDGLTQQWDIEHVLTRFDLGAAADTDENMKPAHRDCHKGKTKIDAGNRAKTIRRETKHQGGHRSKAPMPFGRDSHLKRKMNGDIVDRRTGKIVKKGSR
jgi:5-methylcytosine-specific restriction protein A